MKKIAASILFTYLLCISLTYAGTNRDSTDLPIVGVWKIMSYQIVGYPAMDEEQIKKWIGRQVEFTSRRAALRDGGSRELCQEFSYQVSTETSEGYFYVGYKIKPNRFGITQSEVEVVSVTCKMDSWLGTKKKEFVKISNELMLSNWEGVFFFFAKQAESLSLLGKDGGTKILLITPQSVGAANPKTDFTREALSQTLFGYKIKEVTHTDDDKKVVLDSYQFYRKDKLMLEVYPDSNKQNIEIIRVFDENAIAPSNAKLGLSYSEIFQNDQLVDCQAGIKERSGETLCSFKDMPTIKYIFKVKEDEEGKLSPVDALNQAKLVEFLWKADPSLVMETVPASSDLAPAAPTSTVAPTPTTTSPNPPTPVALAVASPVQKLQTAYKQTDERLNDLYLQLKDALMKADPKEERVQELVQAQKTWLEYRDKSCSVSSPSSGEITSENTLNCLDTLTHQRNDELEKLLNSTTKDRKPK